MQSFKPLGEPHQPHQPPVHLVRRPSLEQPVFGFAGPNLLRREHHRPEPGAQALLLGVRPFSRQPLVRQLMELRQRRLVGLQPLGERLLPRLLESVRAEHLEVPLLQHEPELAAVAPPPPRPRPRLELLPPHRPRRLGRQLQLAEQPLQRGHPPGQEQGAKQDQ